MHINTICAKEVKDQRTTAPHILPIYPTSSFAFTSIEEGVDIFTQKEKGHVYGRYANPTIDSVAAKLAALETAGSDMEAGALMFSSGMAAISTLVMGILKSGDKVLTQGNIYGGTTELFAKIFQPLGIGLVLEDVRKFYFAFHFIFERTIDILANIKNERELRVVCS